MENPGWIRLATENLIFRNILQNLADDGEIDKDKTSQLDIEGKYALIRMESDGIVNFQQSTIVLKGELQLFQQNIIRAEIREAV